MRSPCTATKSIPCSPQLEKAHVQQRRPDTAKKKKKKKFKKKEYIIQVSFANQIYLDPSLTNQIYLDPSKFSKVIWFLGFDSE